MIWVAIAVGGALGSMARHGVTVLVHQRWPSLTVPLATFVVNVVGCLTIGLLAGLISSGRIAPRLYWREFVFVGLLGGFTTFSAFGLDTLSLLRAGGLNVAAVNVIGQVGFGLFAVAIGFMVGARL